VSGRAYSTMKSPNAPLRKRPIPSQPRHSKIPKETEIRDAETLGTKAALACFLPGLETGAPLRKAATPRDFQRQPGKSPFGGDWVVAEAADRNASRQAEFPANRENNREFFNFGPFSAILASIRQATSMACSEILYAM